MILVIVDACIRVLPFLAMVFVEETLLGILLSFFRLFCVARLLGTCFVACDQGSAFGLVVTSEDARQLFVSAVQNLVVSLLDAVHFSDACPEAPVLILWFNQFADVEPGVSFAFKQLNFSDVEPEVRSHAFLAHIFT